MQRTNKIASFFLLSIFSLLMLHQTFPHEHHQHENTAIEKHHGNYDEHHHKHHHGSKDGDNDPSGLIGFLFGSHVHTYHVHDSGIWNIEKHQVEKKTFSPVAIDEHTPALLMGRKDGSPLVPYVQLIYDTLSYSSPTPRGPPALG